MTPLATTPTGMQDRKAILDAKANAKTALQRSLDWPAEPKRAMVCIPAGLTESTGDLFQAIVPGLLTLPIEILIIGKGSAPLGTLATKLAKEHKHRIAIIPNTKDELTTMLQAADMALFFSEPTKESIDNCFRSAVVPVAPATDSLEPYNPIQESGTSFLYEKLDPWHCFAALVRALETHVFPFDWRTIQKHCLESTK